MVQTNSTLIVEELTKALEPMIRRIIKEELAVIVNNTDQFYLYPDMPLYDHLTKIKERKEDNKLEFYSHKEVWDE